MTQNDRTVQWCSEVPRVCGVSSAAVSYNVLLQAAVLLSLVCIYPQPCPSPRPVGYHTAYHLLIWAETFGRQEANLLLVHKTRLFLKNSIQWHFGDTRWRFGEWKMSDFLGKNATLYLLLLRKNPCPRHSPKTQTTKISWPSLRKTPCILAVAGNFSCCFPVFQMLTDQWSLHLNIISCVKPFFIILLLTTSHAFFRILHIFLLYNF